MAHENRWTQSTHPVCTLANGHELALHQHELQGGADGPTLALIAGIHGDEPVGVETIRRTLEVLREEELTGRVVALPVANPYALLTLTRNTPLDMTNLNRVFPGSPDGMLTEQLAHAIVETFLPGCDAVIDLHSGGNLATVDYLYMHDLGGELSRAFGAELYYRGTAFRGSLSGEAEARGIPAVVTELGGGQQRNAEYADRGVRGIVNVLRHLGMVPGEPELPSVQRVFTELVTLRPHQGGMLVSEVGVADLGSTVPRGTVLGRIFNPITFEELEVVEAPFESTILILLREDFTKVDPGDYGFMVANGATAEPL